MKDKFDLNIFTSDFHIMTHEVIKMSQGDYEIFKLVAKDPWFKTEEVDSGTIRSVNVLNKFFNKLQKNTQINTFLDIRDIYKEFIKNNDKIGFNQFESYFLSKLGEYDINKREYQGWIGWEINNKNGSIFLDNQYESDSEDSDFVDQDDNEDEDEDEADDGNENENENGDDEDEDEADDENENGDDEENGDINVKVDFNIDKDEVSQLQAEANKILSQK